MFIDWKAVKILVRPGPMELIETSHTALNESCHSHDEEDNAR